MAFMPKFRRDHDDYESDKLRVRDKASWIEFRKKWFDVANWPRLSPGQRQEKSLKWTGPIEAGGRSWVRSTLDYDLTDEDRYEYEYTSYLMISRFAEREFFEGPKSSSEGWRQECPFDEIVTLQLGAEECPVCGRKLIYSHYDRG